MKYREKGVCRTKCSALHIKRIIINFCIVSNVGAGDNFMLFLSINYDILLGRY